MDTTEAVRVELEIRKDGRYPPEAFTFLHRGLEAAAGKRHGSRRRRQPRHVTGQELCESLRLLAIELWGPLAPMVLASWNIHNTRDFGEMVYLMVRLGLMGKQDSDTINDFDDVYRFREAFGRYRTRCTLSTSDEE